ncbi:MAG: PD-(D/E)XK nuclease family protein [Candidatus Melainabacteria bacterium]|nr:PD-(D/E)XK nuclease family protein [Candidatus Melainabacteria bacterium]
MRTALLPDSIINVRIPRYFSPSRFTDLENCPLKVFGNENDRPGILPPSPAMMYGSMLHHIREQLILGCWGNCSRIDNAFDSLFQSSSKQMDELLLGDLSTSRMVPLSQTLGRTIWNARRLELREWRRRSSLSTAHQAPRPFAFQRFSHSDSDGSDVDQCAIGPEALVVCNKYRIRGRADLIDKRSDGVIEITDFKTGRLTDRKGKPIAAYSTQLSLYGLAAENSFPDHQIRLFLEGYDRIPVPWSKTHRSNCIQSIQVVEEQFPVNTEVNAEDLARPGACCVNCQLRPICPAYLKTAPDWWFNDPNQPRPIPLDTWGRVTMTKEREDSVTLDLRDAAGRSVRIDGLAWSKFLTPPAIGETMYFFNLEPTERTMSHGARIHPRNFHELPPDGGRIFKRAATLQVYRESD